MNREIEFRGKRVDNSEWVYGDLTGGDTIHTKAPWVDSGTYEWWGYEVIEESIGQYTGLKDKNRKKIFEGDVVQITDVSLGEPYTSSSEIIWGQKGSWHPSGTYCENLSEYITSISGKNNSTVIGNIHEHPELLKS
jgi:uncharacterized phage protein (TIGR01671 family)